MKNNEQFSKKFTIIALVLCILTLVMPFAIIVCKFGLGIVKDSDHLPEKQITLLKNTYNYYYISDLTDTNTALKWEEIDIENPSNKLNISNVKINGEDNILLVGNENEDVEVFIWTKEFEDISMLLIKLKIRIIDNKNNLEIKKLNEVVDNLDLKKIDKEKIYDKKYIMEKLKEQNQENNLKFDDYLKIIITKDINNNPKIFIYPCLNLNNQDRFEVILHGPPLELSFSYDITPW